MKLLEVIFKAYIEEIVRLVNLKNIYKVSLGLILVFVPLVFIFFAFESSDNNAIVHDKRTEIVFAIIGDYGKNTKYEKQVSELVHSWNPQFIITAGDNNYHEGKLLDDDIGKFYSDFIGNYNGIYGNGSEQNRLYPSIGNHDWDGELVDGLPKTYLDYFSVLKENSDSSGTMLYYDFVKGPIHFFALDSDKRQPDGIDKNSIQAKWLNQELKKSSSNYNIVYFHHPPFSNAKWKTIEMDWPFQEWGTDVVISGHAHTYERFDKNGIPYIVNGLGGHDNIHCLVGHIPKPLEDNSTGGCRFQPPLTIEPGTVLGYNSNWGAMLVQGTDKILNFTFIDINQTKIDSFLVSPKNYNKSFN